MKKLFVVMVLAMLLLTACGGGNPLLGEWEFSDIDAMMGSADLQGMEDYFEMGGSLTFAEDDTFDMEIAIDMDFLKLMTDMGMGDIEMDSEHLVVSVVIDGDYTLEDGDKVNMEIADVTASYDPQELCMTFMGETQCLSEEDLAGTFDADTLDFEDEFSTMTYQIDGDTMVMWDDTCDGPEEDCAIELVKK